MQFTVITDEETFASMGAEWNALLEKSAIRVPFLRHEYLFSWWETRGGGEWPQASLYIVTARDAEGRLQGIAPLFRAPDEDGQGSRLLFLGSVEISDFLDFLTPAETLPDFVHALFDYLIQQPEAWQAFDAFNLLEDSPSLALLEAQAQARGWRFRRERLQPAPRVALPDSWEAYLAGIKKKQRHEIRRKVRRAENDSRSVRWYIVEDEASLDAEMDAFLRLMAYDPQKDAFLTEVMRSQMRRMVHAAFQAGWLQLAFLEVDGEKAAAYLNLDFDNQIWVYNSGLNANYRDLSPGWVLLSYLIQWAIANGRTAFDFMRGDEDYKYRFGGQDRFVWRARLTRSAGAP